MPYDRPFALFKESWKMFKKNFWQLFGFSAWLLVPQCLLLVLIPFEQNMWAVFGISLVNLAAVILSVWITIAILRTCDHLYKGDTFTSKTITLETSDRITLVFMTLVLQALAIVGGLFLLAIPGFIFAIWYNFAANVCILEGSGPVDSMKASRLLSKGRFFSTAWRIIGIPTLISTVISIPIFAVAIIFMPYDSIEDFFRIFDHPLISTLGVMTSIISLPLLSAYDYLLYTHLKKTLHLEKTEATA